MSLQMQMSQTTSVNSVNVAGTGKRKYIKLWEKYYSLKGRIHWPYESQLKSFESSNYIIFDSCINM
jgi:hypothetical protein